MSASLTCSSGIWKSTVSTYECNWCVMPDQPYLLRLTTRLAEGLSRLPVDFRKRHAAYLADCQNPDGGFSGREGESDLYYTGFALRGLACLGCLTEPIVSNAAKFLRGRLL